MKTIINRLPKIKYELITFAVLCINLLLFLTKEDVMQDRFFGALAFDTHFGPYSLTLIGSITNLLGLNSSRNGVILFQTLALLTGYLLTAIFCGGVIKRADDKIKKPLLCIFVFVALIQTGFSNFTELFDLLDIYWVIGVVLSLFAVKNDYTRFIVPLLAATSLWVHFGFLLMYMPLVYIMCFYYFVRNKKLTGGIQLVFMVLVTVPAALWFFLGGRFNEFTQAEVTEYLASVTGVDTKEIGVYVWEHFCAEPDPAKYDYSLFFDKFGDEYNLFVIVMGYIYAIKVLSPVLKIVVYTLFAAPVMFLAGKMWRLAIKLAGDKLEKLVYFLCLISPVVQIFGLFTSSDSSRIWAHIIISQMLLLFMFISDNNAVVGEAFEKTLGFVKKHLPFIACFSAVYFCLIFAW